MQELSSILRRLTPRALALTFAVTLGGASHVALADEEVEIEVAPPAARVEVVPVAPSRRHFWIHGYYAWAHGAHYWVPGRYELIRPDWTWVEARWGVVGRRWHFYPGHWTR